MPTINLTAKGRGQELILAYLTENASEVLADKINNGTPFEKDGKQLVNKKDLNGFMTFACAEAKKLAEKGSNSACVEDSVVYGWAIHYFEEDSIEGKLYNQDGTEYKPPAPVKKTTASKTAAKPTPTPKPKSQFSFFDMLNEKKTDGTRDNEQTDNTTEQPNDETTEQKSDVEFQADDNELIDNTNKDPSVEEIADALQQALDGKQTHQPTTIPGTAQQPKPNNPLYEKYITYVNRYPDSVIAMRVGDFYEVFGKRAVELADELNLTLTSRDLGLEKRIPMIGFPYHVAEIYFKKLRKIRLVVVIEDDGERKLDEFGLEDIIDGDDKLTDEEERIIYDDLTEEEMRKFDGDITEPKDVLSTPSKEQAKAACMPTDPDSPYDETALAKVVKLLGDCFILG